MIVPYAEHGYQVLIQSCRGTAGFGDEFVYARHEHDDGLATLEWIRQQQWFSGELATVGASYLGFVQPSRRPIMIPTILQPFSYRSSVPDWQYF